MTDYGKNASLTYSDYLHISQLLEQQECLCDPPAHDEMQFIVVHQIYELWFRLILHELDEVLRLLKAGSDGDIRNAVRLLHRVREILKIGIAQLHVLETMRPADFLAFRARLNPASGFQSVQFREIECALGLKNPQLASYTKEDPRHAQLQARLENECIRDVFHVVLRSRGFDVKTPNEDRSEEDTEKTLRAFRALYDDPDNNSPLYELCEALVEIDEHLALWRRHHIMMVERQIGDKPGTGKGVTGDLDGIRYLATTFKTKIFPDLWNVRTMLAD